MLQHSKAEYFFTDSEKKRIEEATTLGESCTTGEIAVMVVDESSHYREAEILGGVSLGSLAALVATIVFFHESIWWYIPLSFILYFPAWFLFKYSHRLKILCVGNAREQLAVKERAIRAFYEKELYRTKDNTGVLFFISLLEHKVWVLADKGIHERIKQPTLNKLAQQIARGIKEGCAADALIGAIKEAGQLLAEHYPCGPEDTNELSNKLLFESRRDARDDS
ncbi:MAG TPA: TPM domain-containing protein [Syntrophorhabdaceae bacterium]|nr:TPM domain-containing protein [Syntrophorhabdaceae bacterium]